MCLLFIRIEADKHVDLLLLENFVEEQMKYHYFWIKNMSGFLENKDKQIFRLI